MLGTPGDDFPLRDTVLELIPASRGEPLMTFADDVDGEDLVVFAPRDGVAYLVTLPAGERVDIVWQRGGELRSLPCLLAAVDLGEQPRLRLRVAGRPQRGQRRDAVRAPMTVPVQLGPGPDPVRATTLDLSEGGLRCVLEKIRPARSGQPAAEPPALDAGGVVRVSAQLPDLTLTCLAEITRRHPRDDARIELSLRFIGLSEHQQDQVRRRVFERLRTLRRRGLL